MVKSDPIMYAHASRVMHHETNPGSARALYQEHGTKALWVNPPAMPLDTEEIDYVFAAPYARVPHPMYGDEKIPAYDMIRFSVNIMHIGFFALRGEMPMNCRTHQQGLDISLACRSDIDAVEALWADCMWAAAKAGQNQGYLLGAFSIADAFFAPAVVRRQAYKVSVNGATQTYINTMLSTPAVKAWMATGVKETIILPADEAGTN